LNTWLRNYTSAGEWYRRALDVRPDDDASKSAIRELAISRSAHVSASFGGSDVDYTRNYSEVDGFAGYVDWLDFYGGYSVADKISYKRTSIAVDAYVFPAYDTYLRAGARMKTYSYPATAPAPDLAAYRRVPDVQLEWSRSFGPATTLSLEGEYFTPNFYYNEHLHAHNFKVALNLTQSLGGHMYVKALAALLRDPDPASIAADPATGQLQSFGYQVVALAGGGVGYDDDRLNAEVKVIPDRDLDHSLQWSLFGHATYAWRFMTARYDLLYDRYAEAGGIRPPDSQVNMFSLEFHPFPELAIRPGVKFLSRETFESVPFLALRYRSGL
jgi:hypothetical protein